MTCAGRSHGRHRFLWTACLLVRPALVAFAVALTVSPVVAGAAEDGSAAVDRPKPSAAASAVRTLETRNKVLAAARLQQQIAPTAANERVLAQEYARAGVLDAAHDHFSAALRLDPHDAISLEGITRVWRDWGYPDTALPYAYRAIYWAPDSAPAQNTLGTVLLRLGSVDAARDRFERARALAPDAAYPLNNLCYLEVQQANVRPAIALCQQALERDPESSTVRNNLAIALAASGDVEKALATLETGQSPAMAAYNRGILLLASRQPERAREAFSEARVADPGFLPALQRLKQLASPSVQEH